ncbi:MFS transporter [Phycicoccus sp. CSK15P-2]|uniref:MFS transporter n=1 Tax=Phycicoccus sp. CSK15P-2 TaxID=2807627 RepID=UPI00194FF6B1|nr:MFS transporter [Phycicoccus sp. CSK15P-2]MBM6403946.1 MFS transporter [Phycicoccus sp. CSK15P-2]
MRTAPSHRPAVGVVALGIVVLALSLRGPIVAVTPVLSQVADDLGLGRGGAGLLATLPVLAFAVLSPAAALVIRRLGPEAAVVLALGGVLVSQLVRSVPTAPTVFAGTIGLGVAITVGNIVVPVLIQRDVAPARVGAMTGLYAAVLNVGTLLTTLATAPLAALVGWPGALASWASLAVVGLVVWAVILRRRPAVPEDHRASPAPAERAPSRPVTRLGVTWLLGLTFCVQAFSYFGFTTWLPTYLVDTTGSAPTGAGALASTFQAWGILGSLLVPVLARLTDPRWTAAVVGSLWVSLSVGVVLAPGALSLWLALGGVAQAGGFVVVFSTVAYAARDSRETAGMSALVQSLGYVAAAGAGPALGALHTVTGAWDVPLLLLVGTTSLYAVLSVTAVLQVQRRAVPDVAPR